MKAVVLAAGEGRRLEPLTELRPKPMIPIANRPLLEYVVESAVEAGIDEVVLVVGYKRERIQSYFGDGDDWGIDIEYAVQSKQLGTGHAILQAEPYVDGPFLVLNGDRVIESGLVERFVDGADDGGTLMAVTPSDRPSDYGVVTVEDDRVVEIVEKPPTDAATGVINAGVYRFDDDIFGEIRATETDGELEITATLDRLAEGDGTVRPIRYDGLWLDVSHLWDVVTVNAGLLDRGEDSVSETARISESAVVSGAVTVGEDTAVGPNATVLRDTALGDNVSVGPGAVIANSVVLSDATIGAGAVIRDCVVGENASVGPNATIEGGSADVVVDGSVYEDVRLGGVVGDNASLGGGVTIDPGAVVGNRARVEGGTALSGWIPSDATVRRG